MLGPYHNYICFMLGKKSLININYIELNISLPDTKYVSGIITLLNQKTYVPVFSQKYFTIWGRNMDTKHTTGEQITGN
jgi:hypothetical protein